MSKSPQGAQSTIRALRLLKQFTAERPELSLGELSEQCGLNKTTAYRLLQALLSEALLARDAGSGAYRLGPAVMALGVQAASRGNLREIARPLLRRLADETGETATLEVPVEDTMLILDEIRGGRRIAAAAAVGSRWAIHATATGKAVVAFGDDGPARLPDRLVPLTARTITERARLEAQLDEVRRRGFAETVDELEDGFAGVATVVRDGSGEILAAMSICGPTPRLSEGRRARLGATLCAAAGQLRPQNGGPC